MIPDSTTSLSSRLLKLAALYRAAQLFAHQCHWIVTGSTFTQDHAFFGETYEAYADAVDPLVELAIGEGGVKAYDGVAHHEQVMEMLRPALAVRDRVAMLKHLQTIERQLQASLNTLEGQDAVDLGVGDLLQRLAGESKHRAFLVRGFLE